MVLEQMHTCQPARLPSPQAPGNKLKHTPHQGPHTTYQIDQLALNTIISTATGDAKGGWMFDRGI